MEKKFVNEIGHDISLKIEKSEKEVVMKITGPDSESEWIITEKEAQEIHDLLGKILK